MKLFRAGKMVITLVCLGVLLQAGNAHAQFLLFGNPLQGKPAPDFALRSVDGKTQQLAELLKESSGAIIFFWATWCPHCRTQIAELAQRRAEIEKDGIRIVVIDIGEQSAQVAAYLKRGGIALDVLLDMDSSVAEAYQIAGVPTFFFLSADGTVLSSKNLLPKNYRALLAN